MNTDNAGRQWHQAPFFQSAPMTTGAITGAWVAPSEEVEWLWTHSLDGKSYISGYTIRKKTIPFGDGDVYKEKAE